MAEKDYARMRVRVSTIKKLRRLFGVTGEKMIDIVERLVAEELKRTEFQPENEEAFAPVWPESEMSKPEGTTIWPDGRRS